MHPPCDLIWAGDLASYTHAHVQPLESRLLFAFHTPPGQRWLPPYPFAARACAVMPSCTAESIFVLQQPNHFACHFIVVSFAVLQQSFRCLIQGLHLCHCWGTGSCVCLVEVCFVCCKLDGQHVSDILGTVVQLHLPHPATNLAVTTVAAVLTPARCMCKDQ